MIYNNLQLGIFTTIIGFVTWLPFLYHHRGQVTKPIMVVKMPSCKLLYIIQVKGFSWPYLISKILVAVTIATMLLLIGLAQPGYF